MDMFASFEDFFKEVIDLLKSLRIIFEHEEGIIQLTLSITSQVYMKTGSRKIKVFFCYESGRGGGAFAMKNLLTEFRKNHEVTIYHKSSEAIKNWRIISFFKHIYHYLYIWFKEFKKRKNIDWVYTSTYLPAVAAMFLKRKLGYKICYHYHVSEIPDNPYIFPSTRFMTQKVKIWTITLLHLIFVKHIDLLIVPSKSSEKEIRKRFKNINKTKIKIVMNGVDDTFFENKNSSKEVLRRQTGIVGNNKIISYFGRLEKHKNVDLLIKTIALISQTEKFKLLITYLKPNNIAEHEYHKYLKKLAKQRGVQNRILWRPNPKKISDFYRLSDLVILPSQTEQMPLVMLEAFASRVLFCGTAVGGVTEVLKKIDKELILYNKTPRDLATQIMRIINFPKNKKRDIITKEYLFVRDLNWNNISQKIYKMLITF